MGSGNLAFDLDADIDNTGEIVTAGGLCMTTTGALNNSGTLAGDTVDIDVNGTLSNCGLIDGGETRQASTASKGNRWRKDSSTEVGSTLRATSDLPLSAGRDLSARASDVTAGGDIRISATGAGEHIEAGDKGFDVRVGGDTTLTGAAIASTQAAVDNDRNRFSTGGSLTLADLENRAEYDAQGASLNIGTGVSFDGAFTPQGTSAGFGEDSDSARSINTAGISGIAGDTAVRTGDAPTGIVPIFDAEAVQKDIDAQVKITEIFSQQAHQAVSSYVQEARQALREQINQAETEADKAALQARLDELLLEERVMNVLIGAVTGMGGTALLRESLSAAADEMRRLSIENSRLFDGITDGNTTLTNLLEGKSEGLRGDGVGLGGTRAIWICCAER
ncbi:hypothetical protein [Thauera linaloolentis]|uniref:Adhesin n=1 Tax=Thauera linaloolentis (strain DSM 12138 / JCM 21573 / CCUG 41526 / CIP 105981 / IAM 15112 / NBRC 102519 / 47Lol) TaxID=1123367 RepID=N6YE87_THAL4|nr:hypothetical protein [Thauera linaloolentis]ENO89830.1 adhesin [Thauera linaloolentis 47Lol = DSM 12138]MCM8566978.1 hypothetical protein [Thauera linaloolentis]